MGIAITLARYLAERGVKYEVVEHSNTATALESARRGPYIARPPRQGGGP